MQPSPTCHEHDEQVKHVTSGDMLSTDIRPNDHRPEEDRMDPLSSWALIATLTAATVWGVYRYTRWANSRHRPPRVHDATLRAIHYAEDRGREVPRANRTLE